MAKKKFVLKKGAPLQEQLAEHFRYLADVPGFETILPVLFSIATKAEQKDDVLTIYFPDGHALVAAPPAPAGKYKSWPKSFKKIVAQHETLLFSHNGSAWGLQLGEGDFDMAETRLEWPSEVKTNLIPLVDFSDAWIYHSSEKLAELYEKQKNTEEALNYYKIFHQAKEDVKNIKSEQLSKSFIYVNYHCAVYLYFF